MFECPRCEYKHESINSMRIHCQKCHKIDALALWKHYNGSESTCRCGCGEKTKFLGIRKGFAKYIRGHAARVENNWGHNKEAQKKSQATRRKEGILGFQKGYTPWNKGETKDTHDRLRKLGETQSKRNGENFSKIMSER
jgi:hypothetical protein